jgi:hypothetical protein
MAEGCFQAWQPGRRGAFERPRARGRRRAKGDLCATARRRERPQPAPAPRGRAQAGRVFATHKRCHGLRPDKAHYDVHRSSLIHGRAEPLDCGEELLDLIDFGHPALTRLQVDSRIAGPRHLPNAMAGAALTRFTEIVSGDFDRISKASEGKATPVAPGGRLEVALLGERADMIDPAGVRVLLTRSPRTPPCARFKVLSTSYNERLCSLFWNSPIGADASCKSCL